MNPRRATALTAVAAATLLTLSACGSSTSSSSSGSASQSASASPSKKMTMKMSDSPSASSSPSKSASSKAAKPAAAAAMITIKDYKFSVPSSVKPGQTIMIMNADSEAHTVTADSGNAFDINVPGSGSAMFKAPAKAGAFPFHCNYHAQMTATLKVG